MERPSYIEWETPVVPPEFTSFHHARCKFFEITVWAYFQPNTDQVAADIRDLRRSYKRSLAKLKESMAVNDRQSLQAKLLEVRDDLYRVAADIQSGTDKMKWDAHIDELKLQLLVCREVCYSSYTYDMDEPMHDDFDISPGIYPIALQIAMSCRDPLLRRLAVDLLRKHHERCGHTDECLGVILAEQVIQLEEQDNKIESCTDIPAVQRLRLWAFHFDNTGRICLRYSRSPFTKAETKTISVSLDATALMHGKTIQTFPLTASSPMHQGLIRKLARTCYCKSFGNSWYQETKPRDACDSWLQSCVNKAH